MIPFIVKVEGGLGNQLLQYLFGCSLTIGDRGRLIFDISEYVKQRGIRKLALTELDLPGIYISCSQKTKGQQIVLKNIECHSPGYEVAFPNRLILEKVEEHLGQFSVPYSLVKGAYFSGYWQSFRYWSQPLQQLQHLDSLLQRAEKQRARPQFTPSLFDCAVHVRRGDYLNPEHLNWHGICAKAYYQRAIEIQGSGRNIFFTDDPAFANSCYSDSRGFLLASGEGSKDIDEFLLMRKFRKIIASNSSCSYVASLLSSASHETSSIVVPYPWYCWTDSGPDSLPEWNTLNRESGNLPEEDQTIMQRSTVCVAVLFDSTQTLASSIKTLRAQSVQATDIVVCPHGDVAFDPAAITTLSSKSLPLRAVPRTMTAGQALIQATTSATADYIAILSEKELWDSRRLETGIESLVKTGSQILISPILPQSNEHVSIDECNLSIITGDVYRHLIGSLSPDIVSLMFVNKPCVTEYIGNIYCAHDRASSHDLVDNRAANHKFRIALSGKSLIFRNPDCFRNTVPPFWHRAMRAISSLLPWPTRRKS